MKKKAPTNTHTHTHPPSFYFRHKMSTFTVKLGYIKQDYTVSVILGWDRFGYIRLG